MAIPGRSARQEEEARRGQDERREEQEEERQSGQDGDDLRGAALRNARRMFELPEDFDCETLKQRYRALTQKLHPDKGGSNFFQQQLNAAYNLLKRDRRC